MLILMDQTLVPRFDLRKHETKRNIKTLILLEDFLIGTPLRVSKATTNKSVFLITMEKNVVETTML
jgi:hypothetical protein